MSNSEQGRSVPWKGWLVTLLVGLVALSSAGRVVALPQDPQTSEETSTRQARELEGLDLTSWAASLGPLLKEGQELGEKVPVFYVVRSSEGKSAKDTLRDALQLLREAISKRPDGAGRELSEALLAPVERALDNELDNELVDWGGVTCLSEKYPSALLKTLSSGFEAAARAGEYPVEAIFDIPAPASGSTYDCQPHGGGPVDLGHTGLGQAIAVLDSGIASDHSFFRNLRVPHPSGAGHQPSRVVSEACYSTYAPEIKASSLCPDGVTKSEDPGSGVNCSLAWCEHGTHSAGIASGSDPHTGYPDFSGIAQEGSLIAVQVFSKVENIGYCQDPEPCILSYEKDRILALNRVYELSQQAEPKYRIVAVSMGQSVGQYETAEECEDRHICLKLAIDRLSSSGIPVIVPSGNEHERERLGAPACISSTVSVGATNDRDEVAGFSNVAPPGRLDLLAPGVGIGGAVPAGFEPGDAQVGCRSGTSMAAARVAGAFALLAEAEPTASAYDILQALRSTGVPIDDDRPGGEAEDLPRIDVCAALRLLTNSSEPCP